MPFPSNAPVSLARVKDYLYTQEKSTTLDKFSTKAKANTTGAWSNKLVFSEYSGPILNIRRGSDNAYLDFYADFNGRIGTAYLGKGTSLSSWLGGSTGYVAIMYDQSGNSRHLRQATAANQPTIGPVSLLDSISAGAKTACTGSFHCRRISSTYVGPTFNLRRDSDNATLDFYADISGNLGTTLNAAGTSVQAWGGPSILYVAKWYDQSGKGNHAVQATANIQPTYYPVQKILGFGNQTGSYLTMPSGTIPLANSQYTIVFKHGVVGNESGAICFAGAQATNQAQLVRFDPTACGYYDAWWANDKTLGNYNHRLTDNHVVMKYDGTNKKGWINGSLFYTTASSGRNTAAGTQYIGSLAGVNPLNGELYYFHVFNTAISDADHSILIAGNDLNNSQNNITYDGLASFMRITETSNATQYPPVGSVTSNSTTVSGQPYGNGVYTCSVSSEFSAGFTAFYVFDTDPESGWASLSKYVAATGMYNASTTTTVSSVSYSGEWLQIQMPVAIALRTFSMKGGRSGSSLYAFRSPRKFVIAGSNDGTTWTLVHYENIIVDWTISDRFFIVNTNKTSTFSYFRIVVTEISNTFSGSVSDIAEICSWKLNPAMSLTRGSNTFSYLCKIKTVRDRHTTYQAIIDQATSPFSNNQRAGIILTGAGNYYYVGQFNDVQLTALVSQSVNRSVVVNVNHNLYGGATNDVVIYDNGYAFQARTAAPGSHIVGTTYFTVGMNGVTTEPFMGDINEVIVIDGTLLSKNDSLMYSRPSTDYALSRIKPRAPAKIFMDYLPNNAQPSRVTNYIVHGFIKNVPVSIDGQAVGIFGDFASAGASTNSPTYTTSGPTNDQACIRFTSSNSQYLTAGSKTFNMATNGGFTAISMVYIAALNGISRIFDFNSGAPNDNILLGTGSSVFYFHVYNGGTQVCNLTSDIAPPTNTWILMWVRYTHSNTTYEIGIGNTLHGSVVGAAASNRTVTNTYIGKSPWAADTYADMYLSGFIAYDASLSYTEISNISNLMTSQTNSLYPSLPVNTDYSNINHVGRIISLPPVNNWVSAPNRNHPFTYGYYSNDGNAYTDISDVPAFPISMALWVYPTASTTMGTVMSMTDPSGNNIGFNLDYDVPNTQFIFFYNFSGTATLYRTGSAINTWYHIVIVITNVGVIQTWVNGSLLDQRTGTLHDTSRSKSRLLLGHAAGAARGFAGYIKDFRLYDYHLRDYQISDMYPSNYRNNGMLSYTSPANYLVTRHNWYSKMTFVQNGGATFVSGDPDPYKFYYIAKSGTTSTFNQVSMNTRIQDYQSFTCTFELYTSSATADHFYFFCGATTVNTTGTSYFNGTGISTATAINAYVVNFQIYGSPIEPGIYLTNIQTNKIINLLMSGKLGYSGNLDWLNTASMIPVTITYNKGPVNTWTVNVNGIDVINYSDPNYADWLAISGSYWGFGAYCGGLSADIVIRSVELSYTPTDSAITGSALLPGPFSLSSMRGAPIYGLIPGWTWKISGSYKFRYDVTYHQRNTYRDIGRSTDCTNILTVTGGKYPVTGGIPVNTSMELVGYFVPPTSGYWRFYLSSDDASYFWIGNTALFDYTIDNAITYGGSNVTVYMNAKTAYPMRVQYVNEGGPGDLNIGFLAPPTTYQLDSLSAPGKTALKGAYALTRLSTTYVGPTIKLRRASDNTVADFYADAGGALGTGINATGTSYVSWLGGTNGQLQYPPSPMNANSTAISGQPYGNGTYIASASATYGGAESPYSAFDLDINTRFTTAGGDYLNPTGIYLKSVTTTSSGVLYYGEWIQIQLPVSINLARYMLYPHFGGYGARSCKDFVLCGSPDGTTWTTLDQRTLAWPKGYPIAYYFSITKAPTTVTYSYFRLICRLNNGDQFWSLGELRLYANNTSFVDTWYDQSGNGFHSTQVVTASQPTFDYTQGLVDFRIPANSFMNMGSATSGPIPTGVLNAPYTFVTRHGIYTGLDAVICYGGNSATNQGNGLMVYASQNKYYNFWFSNDYGFGTLAIGNTIVAKYDGTNRIGYVNGVVQTATASSGYTATPSVQQFLGTDPRKNTQFLNGQLHYLQIYNTSISDADRLVATREIQSVSYDWTNLIYSSTGVTAAYPAESARVIKDIANVNTDGVYYINSRGRSVPTYCLMNDCYNGGGWMMLMKGSRGSTFSYGSNYWTNEDLRNETDTTRNDGDSKYEVFNTVPIKDILAIFPDINSTLYTNPYGRNGGSIYVPDGWTWKIDNWNYTIPLISRLTSAGQNACRGAYALNRLSWAYTGPVIKIRRGGDNAVSDFYADISGFLAQEADGQGYSFTLWIGTAIAYVDTWYDQSGNGFHATQATTTIQPVFDYAQGLLDFRIQAGSYLNMGSATSGPVPTGTLNAPYTFVLKNGVWITGTAVFGGSAATSAGNGVERKNNGYGNYWYNNDYAFGSMTYGTTIVAKYDGTNRTAYINGTVQTAQASSGYTATPSVQQYIGQDPRGGGTLLQGQLYYLQIYNTALGDYDRLHAASSSWGCGGYLTTALNGFQYPRDAHPEADPLIYSGFSYGIFSSCNGYRLHVLGGLDQRAITGSSATPTARWGMIYNGENDWASCDSSNGIGLTHSATSYSAGDINSGFSTTTGITRSTRFELYGR